MKKLYTLLAAMFVAIAANAAWTVYFDAAADSRSSGWTAVNAYIYGGGTGEGFGGWSGKAMTKNSQGLWEITYTGTGEPEAIIFNRTAGSGQTQTGNLVFQAGATYNFEGIVGGQTYEHTVYFNNVNNWSNVYVYAWGAYNDGNVPDYPGLLLSKDAQTGLYKWTLTTQNPNPPTGGAPFDGFLFNNNNDSEKTPDIFTYVEGATYYPNGTTTPGETNKSAWWFNLTGIFAGWDGQANGVQISGDNPIVKWEGISVYADADDGNPAGAFQIKVYNGDGDVYYGTADPIQLDTWTALSTANGTMTIAGDAAGKTYDIEFNTDTYEIYVSSAGGITPPDNLYVLGEVNGGDWNPTKGVAMTNEGDGIFTVKDLEIGTEVNDYGYFSFATQLATADDVANDGNDGWNSLGTRYGSVENNMDVTGETGVEVEETLIVSDMNAFKAASGTYTITVTFEDMLMVIERTGDLDGVDNVNVSNQDAPVVYYNLQGVRVANPTAGQLVIKQQGTTVTKVLVK